MYVRPIPEEGQAELPKEGFGYISRAAGPLEPTNYRQCVFYDNDEKDEAAAPAPAADMTPTPPRIGSTKLRFNDYGKIERIIDRTRRLKESDELVITT